MPDQLIKKWRGRIGGVIGSLLTAGGFVFGPELSSVLASTHQHDKPVAEIIEYLEQRTIATCGQ
jgi:uncharacterized membrane protein